MFEFLRQVKTELGKVVWPSRNDTVRYTLTVIVFSLVVALILGAFDYLLLQLFTAILAR
jgi:preprotein translocase subunit SecE